MRLPLIRFLVALVGLAAAVYGVASLTGGWLGTPPWWEREETKDEYGYRLLRISEQHATPARASWERGTVGRDGREWISGGVAAAGLALVAFAAWPRRVTPRPRRDP